MTADESVKVIKAAGGSRKFAELIGIESKPYWKQRIYNWSKRGIPPRVEIAHLEAIRKLTRRVA